MRLHVTPFSHCCQFRETGTCLSRSKSDNGQCLIGCRSCSGRSVTLWRLVYDNTCHTGTTYRRDIDQWVNQNLRLCAAFFIRRLTSISFPGSLYWCAGLYALQGIEYNFHPLGRFTAAQFCQRPPQSGSKNSVWFFLVHAFLTSFRIATHL
jgi:hypothetical protein